MTALDIGSTRRQLLGAPSGAAFDPSTLDPLPEPVRRYFSAAVAPGTAVATVAALRMRGRIKIGRWLPFVSDEVLSPQSGFVWRARAAHLLTGHDAYLGGRGEMRWRVFGAATIMRADGPDVARSAAGRCGGEGVWLPTALLPQLGVSWTAPESNHIVASFAVDTTAVELHIRIDSTGLVESIAFDRWGDPDRSGSFDWHAFGGEVTEHQTFSGLTVPSSGRWGWFPSTDRWQQGEFFRCRITEHQFA